MPGTIPASESPLPESDPPPEATQLALLEGPHGAEPAAGCVCDADASDCVTTGRLEERERVSVALREDAGTRRLRDGLIVTAEEVPDDAEALSDALALADAEPDALAEEDPDSAPVRERDGVSI